MATNIAVLGFGRTGVSVGLALADAKKGITRIGFDEDKALVKIAKENKAFDEYPSSVKAAVSKADIVVLDVPVDRLRTIFTLIAPLMKEDSILINTAPLVVASNRWAQDLLPDSIHFINAIPAYNYESMEDVNRDAKNARVDLFEKSLIFIAGDTQTRKEVIDVAVDLCVILGGTPYFTDPDEVDGLIANVVLLPQFVAAALAGATMLQPGWDDNQRLASNIFHLALKPLELVNETEDYGISLLQNKKSVMPVIEKYIQTLQDLYKLIDEDDNEGLSDYLLDILLTRKEWLAKRKVGKWHYHLSTSVPLKSEALQRFTRFSA